METPLLQVVEEEERTRWSSVTDLAVWGAGEEEEGLKQ